MGLTIGVARVFRTPDKGGNNGNFVSKTGSGSLPSIDKVLAGSMSRPDPGEILGLGFDHGPEGIPAKCTLLLQI
jgi:hypothetical protein